MKKCPKCGNPSYDGAPVCGNCGYKFPKPKRENEEKEKSSNDEDVITIIKENRVVIGVILLITIIAICGIVLTSSSNNSSSNNQDTNTLLNYSEGSVYFTYPSSWVKSNITDSDHEDAIILEDNANTTIEYYNASSGSDTLQDLTQQRISNVQYYGGAIESIIPISIDNKNGTDILIENTDGSYTRYISILNNGLFHVLKITGDSKSNVNTTDIKNTVESIKLN
ncbi:zinc ribbon domain-containing protein [Methanobrevibacter sp. OttesenSCG-928-K11]|nr:zinc ribbon domain-containing protein [Methanobrevibacter sp. OttesenSCG-928-K11]MDL2270579.1 zinc ribbon domain-containing protein [Methanobrevibacter sp. OttesenSCG-928-I08]